MRKIETKYTVWIGKYLLRPSSLLKIQTLTVIYVKLVKLDINYTTYKICLIMIKSDK